MYKTISIDSFKKIKNFFINYETNHAGLNMSGEPSQLECKIYNFNFLKTNFKEEFETLTLENFKLYSRKGEIYWMKKNTQLFNFSAMSSEDIIILLLMNRNIWETKKVKEQILSLDFRFVSTNDRYTILKRQNWKCNICGINLKFSKNHKFNAEVANIDHIHPFSKRYSYENGKKNINEISNLQALCSKCNFKKK